MKLLIKSLSVVILAFSFHSAFAALGGAPEQFETESITRKGAEACRSATAMASSRNGQANYSVRDTTLPSGTLVREYVSDDGIVFAVSWKGQFQPNLRKLLGEQYFKTMTDYAEQKPAGKKSRLEIEDPEVVIRSRGHMRSHEGRAWLPSHLPSGFSESDIQ